MKEIVAETSSGKKMSCFSWNEIEHEVPNMKNSFLSWLKNWNAFITVEKPQRLSVTLLVLIQSKNLFT